MNPRSIRILVVAVAVVGIGALAGCAGTSTAGIAAAQAGAVLPGSQQAAATPGTDAPRQSDEISPSPSESASSSEPAPTAEPSSPDVPGTQSSPTSPSSQSSAPSAPSSTASSAAPQTDAPATHTIPPATHSSAPSVSTASAPAQPGSAEADPGKFPGTVTSVGFSSPSGNIGCGFHDDGSVVCQIVEFSYAPPKHDCGSSGWGFNFRITAAGDAEMFCAGDVESGGPVLAYDRSITVNGMQCTSQTDGVTCLDTRSGNGFSVAKAAYRFIGQSETPSGSTATRLTTARATHSSIVGQWAGHGRALVIRADGTAELTYRIYKSCDDDPTPPCDRVVGNEIQSGGDVAFAFRGDLSGTSARGKVTASTDPAHPVGAPVTASLQGYNLILSIMDAPFCKADAPSGEWNCGA